MSKEPQKNNSVLIAIAVIGTLGTICAAGIGAMTTYNVELLRQASVQTNVAVVAIATHGGATQDSMATTIAVPTDTPYPTNTVQPTYTPYPTYTAVPIPPTESLSLPFADDFNAGLNPSWKIIRGNPIIVDGKLKPAGDPLQIEIGSGLTGNYAMEFDYFYTKWCCGPAYFEITFGNKQKLTYDNNNLNWSAFQDNKWVNIAQNPHGGYDRGRMKIQTSGNTYEVYINGQLISQIIYGDSFQGPVDISFDNAVWIDNFFLTP
jgi:type II secretory pathway pseudopilin PulG